MIKTRTFCRCTGAYGLLRGRFGFVNPSPPPILNSDGVEELGQPHPPQPLPEPSHQLRPLRHLPVLRLPCGGPRVHRGRLRPPRLLLPPAHDSPQLAGHPLPRHPGSVVVDPEQNPGFLLKFYRYLHQLKTFSP